MPIESPGPWRGPLVILPLPTEPTTSAGGPRGGPAGLALVAEPPKFDVSPGIVMPSHCRYLYPTAISTHPHLADSVQIVFRRTFASTDGAARDMHWAGTVSRILPAARSLILVGRRPLMSRGEQITMRSNPRAVSGREPQDERVPRFRLGNGLCAGPGRGAPPNERGRRLCTPHAAKTDGSTAAKRSTASAFRRRRMALCGSSTVMYASGTAAKIALRPRRPANVVGPRARPPSPRNRVRWDSVGRSPDTRQPFSPLASSAATPNVSGHFDGIRARGLEPDGLAADEVARRPVLSSSGRRSKS